MISSLLIYQLKNRYFFDIFFPNLQTERMEYEVRIEDGKLIYKKSGTVLDSTKGPKDTKWIFVLSTSKTLYVGQKIKGNFQHSSFLAGGATLSAGRLVVDNGYLKVDNKPPFEFSRN